MPEGETSPAASALDNPVARVLEQGGWAAFLALFLIGLALNLTPCVYPMLGVTVSIFGARRAAPPGQVVLFATLYVLGMATMYSALGLVAAFTGGLFGGFLQNPLVLGFIGLLLIGLALSMFGLYELQPPPQLLSKLGGATATSAAGVFLSGLVVGVFAAPCIGPPVVALLAIVGAKGDPWFGFRSFFTLALGLGAPYLVLGIFSNLLQRLPRSGDWMEWVKKVFGVILVAVGGFYLLLAFAPKWSGWIAPVALLLGGLYLGFVERSGAQRRGFRLLKRVTGGAAVVAATVLIVTAPRAGLAFRAFDPAELDATLRSGRLVMLDFSAEWCVPCHELDRQTFTDRRVISRARDFVAFKVDLTRYDSPEAERWRQQFGIKGVPTIVFLGPDGEEVRAARVEGFMPPERFLERMELAARAE
jgi:thiol:disulfide interchange protein DsbD